MLRTVSFHDREDELRNKELQCRLTCQSSVSLISLSPLSGTYVTEIFVALSNSTTDARK